MIRRSLWPALLVGMVVLLGPSRTRADNITFRGHETAVSAEVLQQEAEYLVIRVRRDQIKSIEFADVASLPPLIRPLRIRPVAFQSKPQQAGSEPMTATATSRFGNEVKPGA